MLWGLHQEFFEIFEFIVRPSLVPKLVNPYQFPSRARFHCVLGYGSVRIWHVSSFILPGFCDYQLTSYFLSGIAGGVVSQEYFQRNFGLVNDDNTINIHRSNDVSSNVVSVLQGGAFFGALGSANVSCECPPISNYHSFSSR